MRVFLCLLFLFWVSPAYSMDDGWTPFSIKEDPESFHHPVETLNELVDDTLKERIPKNLGKSKKTYHFCVVGYKHPTDGVFAEVSWPEDNAIILWEPTIPDYLAKLSLSRRYLDLNDDVVETMEDAHGSTYLVDKDWVKQTLAECRKYGDEFTIAPSKKVKSK